MTKESLECQKNPPPSKLPPTFTPLPYLRYDILTPAMGSLSPHIYPPSNQGTIYMPHSPRPLLRLPTFALLVLLLGLAPSRAFPAPDAPPQGPRIIMIIRHAEKPESTDQPTTQPKDPNLSKQGYDRADALAKVFPAHFPKPDFLLASQKSKNSDRPLQTITPLANALHLPVDSTFKNEDFAQLAQTLLTDPKYSGKTILIAWHHGKIPALAKALGLKDPPDPWDPTLFDRVWQITYNDNIPTLQDLPQKALPTDSDK